MNAVLEISGLSVAIAGVQVLSNITLTAPEGAFAGLIGRNGAGKTTLMRAIMGLLPIQSGSIRIFGRDLAALPAHARLELGIGYMPEDRRLVPELTVAENILVPAWAMRDAEAEKRLGAVYEILPEVREFALRRAMQLSGGQQKLVALARALICGRKLLLLDEPFEGVAPALAQRIVAAVSALRAGGAAVLLSESDYVHSSELVDRLYVIERGVVTLRDQLRANAGAKG
jgi:branched-chain amino acid transport system ATP-binding protein